MTISADALEPRPSAIRAWILAARPATLWASAAPVLAASGLAFASGAARAEVFVLSLLGAAAIQIGTNLTNDACDFKKGADRADRLGPARAVAQGWLGARQVAIGAAIAFSLAVACGVVLVEIGGWPIASLGLAGIAAGVAYTAGPWPLAYLGLGELFVVMFFGLGAAGGTYFLHTGRVAPSALFLGAALGALAAAILAVNNLRDRQGDQRANKRTLAVRFGERFARVEYALLIALPYPLIAVAVVFARAPGGLLLALASAPLAIGLIRDVLRRRLDGRALNPVLGRTARLELIFALLAGIGAAS